MVGDRNEDWNPDMPLRRAGLAILLLAAACIPKPQLDVANIPDGDYALDPDHASLVWRVPHLNGLSLFTARFDSWTAELNFDPERPEEAQVTATIDAASVSTGNKEFDQTIADQRRLLDAKSHPEIRFTSTKVTVTGENTAEILGDLTFHGVTAPVSLNVTFNGSLRDPIRNRRVVGFSASGVISRAAWGADGFVNFGVGEEVELLIEAEFLKR